MRKPDFEWKWNTSQEILVLSDFARYLVYINQQLKEGDPGFNEAYQKYFRPLYTDYKNGQLTQLRHGNNLATYVEELQQYLPEDSDSTNEEVAIKALEQIQKIKSYFVAFDDGLINKDNLIQGLRRIL